MRHNDDMVLSTHSVPQHVCGSNLLPRTVQISPFQCVWMRHPVQPFSIVALSLPARAAASPRLPQAAALAWEASYHAAALFPRARLNLHPCCLHVNRCSCITEAASSSSACPGSCQAAPTSVCANLISALAVHMFTGATASHRLPMQLHWLRKLPCMSPKRSAHEIVFSKNAFSHPCCATASPRLPQAAALAQEAAAQLRLLLEGLQPEAAKRRGPQ
eukprot:scaffold79823_cov19-Tisochrysis_lutea.AAC.1